MTGGSVTFEEGIVSVDAGEGGGENGPEGEVEGFGVGLGTDGPEYLGKNGGEILDYTEDEAEGEDRYE